MKYRIATLTLLLVILSACSGGKNETQDNPPSSPTSPSLPKSPPSPTPSPKGPTLEDEDKKSSDLKTDNIPSSHQSEEGKTLGGKTPENVAENKTEAGSAASTNTTASNLGTPQTPDPIATPAHPAEEVSTLTPSTIGSGLRLVPEFSDPAHPHVPDPGFDLKDDSILEEMTVDGNDIVLHRKIFLPDPNSPDPEKKKNLFFVWSEESLGDPIGSAQFTHRVFTPNNQWIGDLNSFPLRHDLDNHLWFIPISELFKHIPNYDAMNADLDDTQVVTLDIAPKVGPNIIVQIKFQISGPLPKTPAANADLDPMTIPRENFIQAVSTAGWMLKREKLTNPSNRPFTVWLSPERNPKNILLSTFLEKSIVTRTPGGQHNLSEITAHYRSQAEMLINQVQIKHQNGATETLEINEHQVLASGASPQQTQWLSFTLRPTETVTLEWFARPAPGVATCSVPYSQRYQTTELQKSGMNLNKPWKELRDLFKGYLTTNNYKPGQFGTWSPFQWNHMLSLDWDNAPGDPPAETKHYLESFLNRAPTYSLKHYDVTEFWAPYSAKLAGTWSREIRLAHPFVPEEEATQAPGSADHSRSYITLVKENLGMEIRNSNPIQPSDAAPKEAQASSFHCQGVFRWLK